MPIQTDMKNVFTIRGYKGFYCHWLFYQGERVSIFLYISIQKWPDDENIFSIGR